ncbi:putative deoxyribonuclease [Wickerhamomyces ciferrii]|uniref:Deoxyribonuclease n=1 Tax=Wickerhamomyces ciferrii (strain ATCC 14091 / BCRC 22168 / CBS 111 / JCM 3599 / NBRC 0793 / NRRL Y-1031 F-60-10) TaxID=1206466 RepID=K0KTP1_WICCF|nr:putative deoxyribonuclease [Wickerhamomyces ciferrii]CCH45392.1 putative deoxyribonuclease [Wickerhamomyces ciferrii]
MIFDAHCHIGTDVAKESIDGLVETYKEICLKEDLRLVLMSTNHIDLEYITKFASIPQVTPSFGVHPWYSHFFTLDQVFDKQKHYSQIFKKESVDNELLTLLPDPIDFHQHLSMIKQLIPKYQKPIVIGEIGLDKLFRIPTSGFYGNPQCCGKEQDIRLTNYKVNMDHQKRIFIEQLKVAFELNLSISIHNVKTSGVIHEILLKVLKDYPNYVGSICLHSYTGSIETLELFIKTFKKSKIHFFISLSSFINNNAKRDELENVLKIIPDESVLIETDITIENHNPMEKLLEIRELVLRYKNWSNDRILIENYYRYLQKHDE